MPDMSGKQFVLTHSPEDNNASGGGAAMMSTLFSPYIRIAVRYPPPDLLHGLFF
jgi:hypothetical protein